MIPIPPAAVRGMGTNPVKERKDTMHAEATTKPWTMRAHSTPARIIDILETEGVWMTSSELELQINTRFTPATHPETINRAMWRLIAANKIQTRYIDYLDADFIRPNPRGAVSTNVGVVKQVVELHAYPEQEDDHGQGRDQSVQRQ